VPTPRGLSGLSSKRASTTRGRDRRKIGVGAARPRWPCATTEAKDDASVRHTFAAPQRRSQAHCACGAQSLAARDLGRCWHGMLRVPRWLVANALATPWRAPARVKSIRVFPPRIPGMESFHSLWQAACDTSCGHARRVRRPGDDTRGHALRSDLALEVVRSADRTRRITLRNAGKAAHCECLPAETVTAHRVASQCRLLFTLHSPLHPPLQALLERWRQRNSVCTRPLTSLL
jgi:hypothetical protein